MERGWCKECEQPITIHADGSAMCGCFNIDTVEFLPDFWTRQDEIEKGRIEVIREQIIDELKQTENLISIAAIIQVSENKINQVHDKYIRDLGGEHFNHSDFIDYLIEALDDIEQIDWKRVVWYKIN